MLGHVLEREKEAREVLVAVELFDFGERSPLAVALAQFEQSGRLDRAFEMEVQLGLGQLAEETARQSIEAGGHTS